MQLQFLFSKCKPLICVAVIAFALIVFQYRRHLWYYLVDANAAPSQALTVTSLVAKPESELFVDVRVDSYAFRLPAKMAELRAEVGKFIIFKSDDRQLIVSRHDRVPQFDGTAIRSNPLSSNWTYCRIKQAVITIDKSDFSFSMSNDELAMHQSLMQLRKDFGANAVKQIWIADSPSADAMLIDNGALYFERCQWSPAAFNRLQFRAAHDDLEWVLVTCASFTASGAADPPAGASD